jgi:hypothetical protein
VEEEGGGVVKKNQRKGENVKIKEDERITGLSKKMFEHVFVF